jgi:hypothetical protein
LFKCRCRKRFAVHVHAKIGPEGSRDRPKVVEKVFEP